MPELAAPLLAWYDRAARNLPWRSPDATPWAVLVSEFMLQQTPVNRVLPVYTEWLERWPQPAALAADSPGEAVRRWGRLGYPRRALRLYAAAVVIRDRHHGAVPAEVSDLEALPGVGSYTARAVAAFAFGKRVPVVDTNVRRVVARAVNGSGAAGPAATARDMAAVEALLPMAPDSAARFSVALMELGALVCVAGVPRCADCPLAGGCAWRTAGCPPYTGPRPRAQKFSGTDRQVRGLLMAILRESAQPVGKAALDLVWADARQRERALAGLVSDGLAVRHGDGRYALPSR